MTSWIYHRKFRHVAALFFAAITVASCGGDDNDGYTFVDRGPDLSADTKAAFHALPPETQAEILTGGVSTVSYVGSVDGTELYVGIITNGSAVEVYLCDSATTAHWFSGAASGSAITAVDGSTSVHATISDAGLLGSVALNEVVHEFKAVPASYPSDVWQNVALADDGQIFRGGWIVLPDDTQRGAINRGPTIVATGPLDLAAAAGGSTGDGVVPFSAPATPSEPVPFKSGQYKTKIPPPSVGAQCALLAIKLDIELTAAGQDPNSDAGRAAAEEAAKTVKKAKELGCAFLPNGQIGNAE